MARLPLAVTKLEQVVLNLMINAVHAMESRTSPRMARVATGRDGAHVWLTVEDSGPGVAPGIVDRIFERFNGESAAD